MSTMQETRNQYWAGIFSRRIEQRIVIEGMLELVTPAHFGTGDSDDLTDMPLLTDSLDPTRPLLTGSTLTGALRAYLQRREGGSGHLTEALFGGDKGNEEDDGEQSALIVEDASGDKGNEEDDGEQSALIVEDAIGHSPGYEVRDGVKLNAQSRTAADKGLYDMHLWRAGTTFPLRFELLLTAPSGRDKEADHQQLRLALYMALQGLNDDGITLGSRKSRGYGQIKVKEWRGQAYHLRDNNQLCQWLETGYQSPANVIDLADFLGVNQNDAPDERRLADLTATFFLDGSLLIRAGMGQADAGPDMVHLHSYRSGKKNPVPILSGTSLAGALRARATKIASVFGQKAQITALINGLFGPEITQNQREPRASRLLVREAEIHNGVTDLVQNRVSIDRFTGGARDTALFNEQPVFSRKQATTLEIKLRIRNPTDAEVGLLLLLLKDLWTGDLPIGGESSVGRGRLRGHKATLHYAGEAWVIEDAGNNALHLPPNHRKLQDFVDALQRQLKGESQP